MKLDPFDAMTNRLFLTICLSSLFSAACLAQENRIASSSDYLHPTAPSQAIVPFSIRGEGKRFNPIWGLDQAWISEQNLRKGINHMGKENIGIGRSTFRMTKPLVDDQTLASDQINYLRRRNNMFNIVSDTLPLVLTADQEAGVDAYYRTGNNANVDRWSAMINAHVEWLQANSNHRVAGVSPFNEPDYWTEEGATATNSMEIAKKLKEDYSAFSTISIVGANTLNDDKALTWFTPGEAYYDWGNTHQLAGSMQNYKAFHQYLASHGKIGYNDEMHNVAEAFIGLENGMTVGIWWGYDSRARGEFCDISRHGVRLGYADHATNWTAATVYRHDDGRVKAFLGSSERQAYTTTYQFVSTDHEVYYDGTGPTREIQMTIHGGTGYQKGQKNAERVIDVTWGDDVQPSAINGKYKIMNKATTYVLSEHGDANGNTNISQTRDNGAATQQWEVYPVGSMVDGDYSFHDIKSLKDGKHLDVLNFSTQSGANVIAYGSGTPSTNQQWYLVYAGEGYYYIRNRESALYLTLQSSNAIPGININQQAKLEDPTRQMWKFVPLDATCETVAPAIPSGLSATPQTASVLLTWDANTEEDLDGYMLLRTVKGANQWNTIARKLKDTRFIDNSCRQGVEYEYRLRAIDRSENLSAPCDAVEAAPLSTPSLIAQWDMEDCLDDKTANQFDAADYATTMFTPTHVQGERALNLNGTNQWIQLPYEVASSEEMTFSAWIYLRNSSVANQRIFDFGNGPSQYLYLTPSDGKGVSYVINDGNGEQSLTSESRLAGLRWKHVAVTIARGNTSLYVDGEKVASSTAITALPHDIMPSLNYIGRGQAANAPMLKGYVDDVRIYNYSLSEEEIKQVMDDAYNGIRQLTVEEQPTEEVYYSISGVRMNRPVKGGIYIHHQGKTNKKVVLR